MKLTFIFLSFLLQGIHGDSPSHIQPNKTAILRHLTELPNHFLNFVQSFGHRQNEPVPTTVSPTDPVDVGEVNAKRRNTRRINLDHKKVSLVDAFENFQKIVKVTVEALGLVTKPAPTSVFFKTSKRLQDVFEDSAEGAWALWVKFWKCIQESEVAFTTSDSSGILFEFIFGAESKEKIRKCVKHAVKGL